MQDETALYRHFDRDGHLLYVGISCDVPKRMAGHRARSPWLSKAEYSTVEWYPTRRAAVDAERTAIMVERPLHNIDWSSPSVLTSEMVRSALEGPAHRAMELFRAVPQEWAREFSIALEIAEARGWAVEVHLHVEGDGELEVAGAGQRVTVHHWPAWSCIYWTYEEDLIANSGGRLVDDWAPLEELPIVGMTDFRSAVKWAASR